MNNTSNCSKKRGHYSFLWIVAFCLLAACQQAQDLKAFTEADYRLEGVENVKINGIDLEERTGTGQRLSNQERDELLASVSTNNLQLQATMLLHVSLRAPTGDQTVTITNMKWLVLVEGQEALTGNMDRPMVLHDGLNKIPVKTPVHLTEVDGRPNYEGLSRVINLVSNNSNIRQALTFQIKPTVKTPLGNIESPKFISVSKPRE